jgi:hypothetical protein
MSTAQTGRTHDLHPTASKKQKKSLDAITHTQWAAGSAGRTQSELMNDHVIDQAIYALATTSAVLSVAWAVAVWCS